MLVHSRREGYYISRAYGFDPHGYVEEQKLGMLGLREWDNGLEIKS
jgi:hypothetical protein